MAMTNFGSEVGNLARSEWGSLTSNPANQGPQDPISLLTQSLKLEQAYLIISPLGASSLANTALSTASSVGGPQALNDIPGVGGSTGANVAQNATDQVGSGLTASSEVLGGSVGGKLTFLFNPKSYTLEKSAAWEPGCNTGSRKSAQPQFKGSNATRLNVEVILDSSYSTSGSVHDDVELLFETLQPVPLSLLPGMTPSPPMVIFGWGSQMQFSAYMENVAAEFTLFRPNGTPIRATCRLSMVSLPSAIPWQNPTSGGRKSRRTHTVIEGDTLQSVANAEYAKPTMWRAIATSNGIDDPMRVRPGTTVLVPPKDEALDLA